MRTYYRAQGTQRSLVTSVGRKSKRVGICVYIQLIHFAVVAQLCPSLCNPMDCGPPGSSVCGILQSRILEWVAVPSPKGSSQPRDQTLVSCVAGRFFTV